MFKKAFSIMSISLRNIQYNFNESSDNTRYYDNVNVFTDSTQNHNNANVSSDDTQ